MKKLSVLLCLLWCVSVMGASDRSGYFGISSGMGVSLDEEEKGFFISEERDLIHKFGLEYGTYLILQDGYKGSFGAGASVYSGDILLFHVKYGYELNRESQVSVGVDISGLFGSKGVLSKDLLMGGSVGVTGRVSISSSTAAVVRVMGEFLRTLDGSRSKLYPVVDGSFRWYLK